MYILILVFDYRVINSTGNSNTKFLKIRDGQTVRFWTDIWLPRGRLIDIRGEIGTQKLGIPRNAKISDVLVDGVWRLRNCRDQRIQTLMQEVRISSISLSATDDGVLWKQGPDDYGDRFAASDTWQQVRQQSGKIQWTKLVWFSQGVPRFAFITWLAFKDRLATGQCTRRWGQPQSCLFCGDPDESRDHFFACPYTFTLWIQVLGNLFGAEPDPDWETTILLQLLSRRYDRLTFILLRLLLQVTIYFIWREMNDRKHNSSTKPVNQLARQIDKTVRNRIMSTKYYSKPKLQGLLIRWFEAHMP